MQFQNKVSKTIVLFIFVALIFCSLMFGLNMTITNETTVFADDIVLINSNQDFINFVKSIRNDDEEVLSKSYSLTSDLDLTLEEEFDLISITENRAFKGTFNGNFHTIKYNYTRLDIPSYLGLFCYTTINSRIENLIVEGTIEGPRVGGIVGYNKGIISNCVSLVNITSKTNSASINDLSGGGIAARNDGTINSCIVSDTNIVGQKYLGGIVGVNSNSAKIQNSLTKANVNANLGSASTFVGSIVGNADGILQNVYGFGSCTYLSSNTSCGAGFGNARTQTISQSKNVYLVNFNSRDRYSDLVQHITKYDMLSNEGVTFDETMAKATYETAFGYIYCPTGLLTIEENIITPKNLKIANIIKESIFSGGEGTEASPYEIQNVNDMYLFGENLQVGNFENIYIILKEDVDIQNDEGFGDINHPFSGIFLGNNKKISITQTSTEVPGLFACVNGATIKDLSIDANITSLSNALGSLASYVVDKGVTVESISASVNFEASNPYTGGLFGNINANEVSIKDVKINGRITSSAFSGGLIGNASINDKFEFKNIISNVALTTSQKVSNFGGLVGNLNILDSETNIDIDNLYFDGTIRSNATNVGGLFGLITSPKNILINICGVFSTISGIQNIGNVVGNNQASLNITGFSVISDSSGTSNNISGLVGLTNNAITFNQGFYKGNITKGKNASNKGDIIVINQNESVISLSDVYYDIDNLGDITNLFGATKINTIALADGSIFDDTIFHISPIEINTGFFPCGNFIYNYLNLNNKLSLIKTLFFDGVDTTNPSETVYEISTVKALNNLSILINEYESLSNTYSKYSYKIKNSIQNVGAFNPITHFAGKIYGQLMDITGINIGVNEGTNYSAFIITLEEGAYVDGLNLKSGTITNNLNNSASLAITAGENANIKNCVFGINITSNIENGINTYTSGIVCENSGVIENCIYTGTIRATGDSNKVSGIAGENNNTSIIKNVAFSGFIFSDCYASGISNTSIGSTYEYIQVSGYIFGKTGSVGVINESNNDTISYVFVNARINSNTALNTYGLVDGNNNADFSYCYFNSDLIDNKKAFNGSINDNNYAIQTSEIILDSFVIGGFTRETNKYNFEYDSFNGLYLTKLYQVFESKEDIINDIILKLDDMPIYGREDGNVNGWGTELNPYLVTTFNHILYIRQLVEFTTYENKYFLVTNDIDMQDASGPLAYSAIGIYDADNINNSKPFNGKFYGKNIENNQVKISNIKINYSYINGNYSYNFLGFFAYVSTGFELKNISFDGIVGPDNIDTESYGNGSLVGLMNKGIIDTVISSVSVSGQTMIGGLVGNFRIVSTQEKLIKIKNSVFNGTINATNNTGYKSGIIGLQTDTTPSNIEVLNTFYIINYNQADSKLISNKFGKALFVDNLGDVNKKVVVSFDNTNLYGIKISNYANQYGFLMNSNDSIPTLFRNNLGSNEYSEVFYLNKANSDEYFARFCVKLELMKNDELIGESLLNDARLSATNSGYVYVGQTTQVVLSWIEYMYVYNEIKALDSTSNQLLFENLNIRNSDEDIVFTFTMTNEMKYVNVLFSVMRDKDNGFNIISMSSYEYTGQSLLIVNLEEDDYTIMISKDLDRVDSIIDAGFYSVEIYYLDGTFIKGVYKTDINVDKKVIEEINEQAYFNYVTKFYDGTNRISYTNVALGDGVGNIVEGEIINVNLTLEFYLNSELTNPAINVGSDYYLKITNLELLNNNYELAYWTELKITSNIGVINKKVVTIKPQAEIDENDNLLINISYERNSEITIAGIYEIPIKWEFKKYTNFEEEDTTWDGTTFNVGLYKIGCKAVDNVNFEASLDVDKYFLVINPKIIEETELGNANNLVYDGNIKGVTLFFTDSSISFSILYNAYKKLNNQESFVDGVDYYEYEKQKIFATTDLTPSASKSYYYITELRNAGDYLIQSRNMLDQSGNYAITSFPKELTIQKAEGVSLTYEYYLKSDIDNDLTINRKTDMFNSSDPFNITANDIIYLKAEEDYSKYDYSYVITILNSQGASVKLHDDKNYKEESYDLAINPYKYFKVVSFKIEGINSENYVNSSTEVMYLKINEDILYVSLTQNEYTYGDVINYEFTYKDSNGNVVDKNNISGLNEPIASISTTTYDVGIYDVRFSGGNADGYKLECESTLTINKKEIYLIVSSNITQVYGEDEEEIAYVVYNTTIDEGEIIPNVLISTLPNGRDININGKFSREEGKSVGRYDINHNSIYESENPNYIIHFNISGSYIISRRNIILKIKTNQSKEYGTSDPEYYELQPTDDYSLANEDSYTYFYKENLVEITRAEGESVGTYSYSVKINNDTSLNYNVISVESSDSFRITRARPELFIYQKGLMQYGDTLEDINYTYQATCLGSITFAFTGYNQEMFEIKNGVDTINVIRATFIPENDNYSSVVQEIDFVTTKRRVSIDILLKDNSTSANLNKFVYNGKAHEANEYKITIFNNLDNNYTANITLSGDSKNCTNSGFTVSATLVSDYYVANQVSYTNFVLPKGLIISVDNIQIKEGARINPTFKYDGFINSENENVLTKKPRIDNVNTKVPGIYTITPKDAEASNYSIQYESGLLTILPTIVEDEEKIIQIEGVKNPTYVVETSRIDDPNTNKFKMYNELVDGANGKNIIIPSTQKMQEFIKIDSTGNPNAEELEYSIVFLKEIKENDVIYVRFVDGTIKAVDYEVEENSDGFIVSFTSQEIVGAALYTNKTIVEILQTFMYHIIIGGGLIVIILLIIVISHFMKKEKRESTVEYAFKARMDRTKSGNTKRKK